MEVLPFCLYCWHHELPSGFREFLIQSSNLILKATTLLCVNLSCFPAIFIKTFFLFLRSVLTFSLPSPCRGPTCYQLSHKHPKIFERLQTLLTSDQYSCPYSGFFKEFVFSSMSRLLYFILLNSW